MRVRIWTADGVSVPAGSLLPAPTWPTSSSRPRC